MTVIGRGICGLREFREQFTTARACDPARCLHRGPTATPGPYCWPAPAGAIGGPCSAAGGLGRDFVDLAPLDSQRRMMRINIVAVVPGLIATQEPAQLQAEEAATPVVDSVGPRPQKLPNRPTWT